MERTFQFPSDLGTVRVVVTEAGAATYDGRGGGIVGGGSWLVLVERPFRSTAASRAWWSSKGFPTDHVAAERERLTALSILLDQLVDEGYLTDEWATTIGTWAGFDCPAHRWAIGPCLHCIEYS